MTAPVRDARPPGLVVALLNPVLRTVLRTPIGRMIGPLALIEFAGRRSRKTYRVVVAWHSAEDAAIVLTPAAWRANFAAGAPATVRRHGRRRTYTGTLESDPDNVAAIINAILATGTSPRGLALHIPTGHPVDRDDVEATHRAVIRFQPVGATSRSPTQTANLTTPPVTDIVSTTP